MRTVTLIYLRRGNEVLLAMKKRGFGVGKWNAPGGKAEPGETAEAAAIRECQEEIGVTPLKARPLGDIVFRMPHEPGFEGHHIYVFTANEWVGEPVETEEMRPQWFALTNLPYDQMWPADRRWLPEALAMGRREAYFRGKITQGLHDSIVEYELRHVPAPGVQL